MAQTRPLLGIALGLAIAAASAAGGCGGSARGGQASAGVVAVAGARRIESAQLAHWAGVELAGGGAPSRALARRRALDLLIGWAWAQQQAAADGVSVSEAQARKQLELSKSDLASGVDYEWFPGEAALRPFLSSPRVAEADQLSLVREGLLQAKLARHRAALVQARLTPAQVLAYYRSHRRDFYVTERRDIRAIMNWKRDRVAEAKREMQAGKPFHEIEERFNQSVEGGLRLGRGRGTQEKQYERDYFSAPPHRLIGPRHEILYYVFEVLAIHPGYEKPLAQVERLIRRRLGERAAAGVLLKEYERSWRARTRCSSGEAASRCGG